MINRVAIEGLCLSPQEVKNHNRGGKKWEKLGQMEQLGGLRVPSVTCWDLDVGG